MNYAPILIFGYNRSVHLKMTLDALSQNVGISKSDVFIFLDGKKDSDSSQKVNDTKEMIKTYENKESFNSFNIIESKFNKGLANSIISGVTEILRKYDRVIVLEDDLITSKDFVDFMNEALSYYEKYENIWSISGFSHNMKVLNDIKESVYFTQRSTSWGWATWGNRWSKCDWEVDDYKSFRCNLIKRYKFNRGGSDLSSMLDRQMIGLIDSWAIRWCYSQYKNNALTVCPKKSKIKNIGMDGSGTNTGIAKDGKVLYYFFSESSWDFMEPNLNMRIMREFRIVNSLSMKSRISRFIKYVLCHYNF